MLTVLLFIAILGVLIFVHEFGHFVTARRNGIKADEFGFGFPPRVFGIQFLYEDGKRRKWRIIWGGKDGDSKEEKNDLAEAHKKKFIGGTIYSINLIPLGGFVKIKGEDGGAEKELDSFAGKSAWIRIKVLVAGVMMNFVLAWVLIAVVFMMGAPLQIAQLVDKNIPIKVFDVMPNSPAEQTGIRVGDEILKKQDTVEFASENDFIVYVNLNKGKNINLKIKRNQEIINFSLTPRIDIPDGQGPIGIGFNSSEIIVYSWYEAIWKGLCVVVVMTVMMLKALWEISRNFFIGQKNVVEVAGPVGIFVMAKQAMALGFVPVAWLTALLSINLGVINILPIPALDGGRILFILIEKIKGSPVSQKLEQTFHSVGFMLLILLLVLVTFKDVLKFIK